MSAGTSVDPETPIRFPGVDKSYFRLEDLASRVGYNLNPIDIKTVKAGDIKKIHDLLIEKYGYNK